MSVSYTLRLPNNLKVLLDIEAAKHGQSLASYIVGACWAQLERHGERVATGEEGKALADTAIAILLERRPNLKVENHPKTDIDVLLAISAGGSKRLESFHDQQLLNGSEVPICGLKWSEDMPDQWTTFECLMDEGHKESKHGLRGMVRKLGD